jgi:hypothetical protein
MAAVRRPGAEVPDPPDFRTTSPLIGEWPRGLDIARVYDPRYPLDAFHPGERDEVRGRFHFFIGRSGRRVPVLYGAQGHDAALAETVFHDVPIHARTRFVPARRFEHLALGVLRPTRPLRLVELFGHGLDRLRLRPENLTATEADAYPRTVDWARALHHALDDADGLVWMSRGFNAERALVLFGDRVAAVDLEPVPETREPLAAGPGRERLERAANRAGIVLGVL